MDYLALVNGAILEAGVDLDDLTSASFANPGGTKMYARFKNWVNAAWKDIQLENNEWEFEKATAVVPIYPRVLITNGNRDIDPPAASEFVSNSGGVSFVVHSTENITTGSWPSGTATGYLDLETIDGTNIILLETYNEIFPETAASVFTLQYTGRYDLTDLVSDLEDSNYETFNIQNPDTGSREPLLYVPWAMWKDTYEVEAYGVGMPSVFTQTPEGFIDFHPRPDRQYTISFSYTKAVNSLVLWNDVPRGLRDRHHDAILWRAVMFYADYDENQRLWTKANKRHNKYMNALDRDIGPTVGFGRSRYDDC